MSEGVYYDGTKLLSMKDINGNTPEIFICTSNRTAGKTTYFNRLVVNRFLDGKGKFALLYRFNYELDDCADKFFKDINGIFFPTMEMKSVRKASGIYHELFLNDKSCGYAISINSADQIKKYSHLFSDVERIIFDEFQSESNHYCNDEITKFQSIHTSIARGQNKQVRYVPVYMIANPVSIINPYYVAMDISSRLNGNTKFLRGNGFVLEQGYNASARIAQEASGFNKAFDTDNNKYTDYAGQGIYLNDNKAFIDTPKGIGRYICTLKYNGTLYGIREYRDLGIVHCSDKADATFPYKISVTTEDHNINYVMLKQSDLFIKNLRYYFDNGAFRFKDLRSKEALMKTISY